MIQYTSLVIKRFTQLAILAYAFIFATGCASQNLSAQIADETNLKAATSFYVEKLPADNRGIEVLIANELVKRGFQADYGESFPVDGNFDVLVTYQDKWMWDITMYMIELNIQVKNPETNFVMASGNSYRTSLVRKSKEEMVAEVVGEIFK